MGVIGERAALFHGQLAGLLKAGMPLPEAVRTLAGDAQGGRFQAALGRVADEMERGASAEDAFRAEERALGGILPSVAAATEGSGKLPELLRELSRWTLAQDRIRRQIRDAISYPMVVLFLTSLLFLAMAWVGVESYTSLPDMDMRGDLQTHLELYRWLFLAVAGVGVLIPLFFAFSWGLRRHSPMVARVAEWLALHLPVVRGVARPLVLVRFCATTSVLTKADVPLHEAVAAAGKLCRFRPYEKETAAVAARLAAGSAPDSVWVADGLFPATVPFMVGVGVQRNAIPQAFEELAKLHETEAEGRARLTALLLPPLCLLTLAALTLSYLALIVLPICHFMEIVVRFW